MFTIFDVTDDTLNNQYLEERLNYFENEGYQIISVCYITSVNGMEYWKVVCKR